MKPNPKIAHTHTHTLLLGLVQIPERLSAMQMADHQTVKNFVAEKEALLI